jgi:alanine racemase
MSYIELNKSAFFHNLDIIAQKTADKDKIALVLKDNAYGHGLLEVAEMAKEYGVSKAVVRTEHEAERIRDYFKYILILSPRFPISSQTNYIYTINALEDIQRFPAQTRVELKIDTGMHRNGIAMDEYDEALEKIKAQEINLEALFTHYRSADTMSAEWFWQKRNFDILKEKAPKLRFHSCNSAALFRTSDLDDDMVRVGIAAYGCLQMDRGFEETGLKPVLSLVAEKISSRNLKKGQRIGYNASFEADEDMEVSNYDIGYADGFSRLLSNNYQTPDGDELLGRVSMDNSTYKSIKEKLLVFDDANEVAAFSQTIGYEVLTSLSPSIERRIV